LLSKSLFKLAFKIFAHFRLRSRFLIDPQTNLVGEFLIVKSGREKGILDKLQFNALGPFVRLEIAFNLLGRNILRELRVTSLWLHEDFGHTLIKFFVLDFVEANVYFLSESTFKVKISSIPYHL
jgi:hypothetical protein